MLRLRAAARTRRTPIVTTVTVSSHACPVSLHRYHPHHPLTHRVRHTYHWRGCAHVLASLITVYRLRPPLARVLVTHGLL